ncbi:MAG: tetratricopeptide repeat protein [Bacteroidota bacterium]|nr:tetratricopeptide repeat protein [Bacteroidota bacterium]
MKHTLVFLSLLIFSSCFEKTGPSKKTEERLELLTLLISTDTTERYKDYYEEALTLAKEFPDSTSEINVLCVMGDRFAARYSDDTALLFYREALLLSQNQHLKNEEINCLAKTGTTLCDLGLYQEALNDNFLALSIIQKHGTKAQAANAMELTGFAYTRKRSYDSAMNYFRQELVLEVELKNDTALSACYNNIGAIFYSKGVFDSSIVYYKKTRDIKKKLGDENSVAQAEINIGMSYKNNGSYILALENLLAAARYYEKENISDGLVGICYSAIGNVYIEMEDPNGALIYHNKAFDIRSKIKDKRGIAGSFTNIGEAYKLQGNYTLALNNLKKSLDLKQEFTDNVSTSASLNLIGEVFFLQNSFLQAEDYYKRSLQIKEGIQDPKGTATTLTNLGELYMTIGNYDSALLYLEKGRLLALKSDLKKALLKNYEVSKKVFSKKRDFGSALHYADQFAVLKDTLLNEKKNKIINELQIKYDSEKKEHKIALLAESDKINKAVVQRQHTQIYFLIVGTGLLMIIVTLAFIAYRSRKKAFQQSELIVEQKQALIEQKQVVMRELHHRVKNNLQVLSDMLNLQQGRLKDETTRDALKAVEQRLHAMLLIHRELYNDQQDAQVNMKDYLEKLADNLRSSYGFTKSGVKINFDVDDIKLSADKALNIGFVCNEVISNSFKHAFKKTAAPELTITFVTEKELIRLEIDDNGSGIQNDPDLEKAGSFGLRLINLFVKDLHGSINIVNLNQGSRFEFIIPHS